MANRVENAKPAPDKPQANGAADAKGAAAAPAAAPAAPSGIKAFLPLIANLVLMPVLAYAMTAFVLVPKLAKNVGAVAPAAEKAAEGEGASHGAAAEKSHGGGESKGGESKEAGKGKTAVSLSKKTLVNVSGTMGTRYLLAEFMLVGSGPAFKEKVEKADAELRDAAATALSVKTISDLEKPGVRNLVRTELITVFNSILGKGTVSEIYLTEFAIQ